MVIDTENFQHDVIEQSFTKPTLNAVPGDLSLVLPKRHLDNIIEMIYVRSKHS